MHVLRSAGVCLAALLLIFPGWSPAQQVAIAQYVVPIAQGDTPVITAGPDGALWFTDGGPKGYFIGRITPAGAFNFYPIAGQASGITTGPDGALWFTYNNAKTGAPAIGRITTAGAITEFPLTPASSFDFPYNIAAGPDGALWFTNFYSNTIGRITTTGVVTKYSPPSKDSEPDGIAAGPDGAVWFTEANAGKIGRITTSGAITEYSTSGGFPVGITVGSDGALWFPQLYLNSIGRITTAGAVTEYPLSAGLTAPINIASGSDGALWFTAGNNLGRITTSGVSSAYAVPCVSAIACMPNWITAGPDGNLWFTETTPSGRIGEAVFATAGLGVTPASGSYQTSLSFTGSGFAPNETVNIYSKGIGSTVIATAAVGTGGSFTVAASAPAAPYGSAVFLCSGQSSGKIGAANFSVIPSLILNPNSGAAGSITTISGYGFDPWQNVKIYWNNPRAYVGQAINANNNGTFSGTAAVTVTVPSGASPGANLVYGVGPPTGAGTFTVQ